MVFTVSLNDNSVTSLESLYSAPIKTVGYTIRVATLAFLLFVASLNADAYDAKAHPGADSKQVIEYVLNSIRHDQSCPAGIPIAFNKEYYKLFAKSVNVIGQRNETYNLLRESFYANFNEGQSDMDHFAPSFRSLAKELCKIKIDYAFVDISRKKDLIDFNLDLEEGLFMSVAKEIEEDSDNVMFSIARMHKTLAIGEMPLYELMTKVAEVMTQLKEVSLAE